MERDEQTVMMPAYPAAHTRVFCAHCEAGVEVCPSCGHDEWRVESKADPLPPCPGAPGRSASLRAELAQIRDEMRNHEGCFGPKTAATILSWERRIDALLAFVSDEHAADCRINIFPQDDPDHVCTCRTVSDEGEQLWVVTEGLSGTWFYHRSRPERVNTAICGRPTMPTSIPPTAWGHVSHLGERWCKQCVAMTSSTKDPIHQEQEQEG